MSSQDLKITSFFTPKQPTTKSTTNPQQEPTQEQNQNPTTTPEEQPVQELKQTPAKTLTLTPKTGSLFTAPPNHLLIHACNTVGSWGAGIASAFRTTYPKAYKHYREYCLVAHDPSTNPVPTGTCLLIPPCETRPGAPKHWIGCLFTSERYGKKRDPPAEILRNTGPAVRALLREVKERGGVEGVRMCKINSGLFAVEWEKTAATLEGIVLEDGWKDNIEVWSMDE